MSANPVPTVPRTFSDHGAVYELAEKYPDFGWKETAVDRFWLAE